MKLNVSNHNLLINGEKVKEIEFLYDVLLRKGPLKPNKPEKKLLVIYHLESGSKWELEADLIVTEEDLQ